MATGWLGFLCYLIFLFVVDDIVKVGGPQSAAPLFSSVSVVASKVNYTIDDSHPTVSYSPGWMYRNPMQRCIGCFGELIDPAQVFNQTWHDATGFAFFEFEFTGTSITIYGTVPNGMNELSNYSFEVDAVPGGPFAYTGLGGESFLYQRVIFQATGLEPGVVHRLYGQNDLPRSSMVFDYAVVENETPDSTVGSGLPPNSTGTSASAGAQLIGKPATFPVAAIIIPIVLILVGTVAGAALWMVFKRRRQEKARARRMGLDLAASGLAPDEFLPPSLWVPPHMTTVPTTHQYIKPILYPTQPLIPANRSFSASSSSIISGSSHRTPKTDHNGIIALAPPPYKAPILKPLPITPIDEVHRVNPPNPLNPLYHHPNQHTRTPSDVVPQDHLAHFRASVGYHNRATASQNLRRDPSTAATVRTWRLRPESSAVDNESEINRGLSMRSTRPPPEWDENRIRLPPIPRFSAIPSSYFARKSTIKGRANDKWRWNEAPPMPIR